MVWLPWAILTVIAGIYIIVRAKRASAKYSAVQNAYLAKYTYNKLSPSQQEQVMQRAINITKRGDLPFFESPEEDFKMLYEIQRFSLLALAMWELNILPTLPNEHWHYVKNPYIAAMDTNYQINVIKRHLSKTYGITISLKTVGDGLDPSS